MFIKLLFVFVPAGGVFPIASDKDNRGVMFEGRGKSVERVLRFGFVDVFYCFYNFNSLVKWYHWFAVLVFHYQFVCVYADDQIVAILFCIFEDVQMSDVE